MKNKYLPDIVLGAVILAAGIVIFLIITSLNDAANEAVAKKKSFSTAEPEYLKLVTLDNGMPCVKDIKRGGLTCDWDFKTRGGE